MMSIKSVIQQHIKAGDKNWYTEKKPLGKGGFGEVFLCRLNENGSEFALKKIKQLDADQISKLSRTFISSDAERESLPKTLSHKNIINFYDAYALKNGEFHIFMEYAPGGSLRDKYNKEELSDKTIAKYVRSLIDAVEYLHKKNIVHNDIKCDNILFTSDGTLKLTDFGLANTLKPGLKYFEALGGTPCFMAPEVGKGEHHTFSSDIWTIGTTTLEMKLSETPRKIRWEEDPLRDYQNDLSTDIKEFLYLCLKVDRRQRASIDDLKKSKFLTKY